MSKSKNAVAAGVLVLALGASAAGLSALARTGPGEAEPYRTLVPAPSPTLSVPAEAEPEAPVREYVAVPAPTTVPVSPAPDPGKAPAPDAGVAATEDPGGETSGGGVNAASEDSAGSEDMVPVDGEQLETASRTAWDAAERDRVAAALAAADAYTAAHPGTAEAAVYTSVRAGMAGGSAGDGTALVTRALRSAGYTFTGCGPQDILNWFTGHPDYGAVVADASSARPGSLVVARGRCGNPVIGVYLSDGLAVFGGDAAVSGGIEQGAAGAGAEHALIAPADLTRTALLPAGTAAEETPVYVRPAPFS
ncbi:hypothetical protein ACWGQ2_01850 [Arthrobacter sp. NPDC055585]